jgi:hypothetical protein
MGGLLAALGAFLLMGDADDSYNFEEIGPFIEGLKRGYDVVLGNRYRGSIKPGAMLWHHRLIGNLSRLV